MLGSHASQERVHNKYKILTFPEKNYIMFSRCLNLPYLNIQCRLP